MKKLLISTSLVAALFASSVFAQDKSTPVVVASGMQGGGYHTYALKLAERMKQRGYADVSVVPTNGSDAITLAACNNKADVWISQIDAIYTRYKEGCVLVPVADYGNEVAVIMFPPKSDFDELADLGSTNRIAVDGIGSGTELFWKTIVSIENGENGSGDGWAKALPVESSPDMLNTMANFGDIDAAVLVRGQNSDQIKFLMDQGWSIGEFWDKDINDEEFNTRPLYESQSVEFISQNDKSQENYVYLVRSFIGVAAKYKNDRGFKMDVASSTN